MRSRDHWIRPDVALKLVPLMSLSMMSPSKLVRQVCERFNVGPRGLEHQ
ncbi:hypothetical protein [Synechococcus sp. A15-60]|nr:hypothetical protein [Synechococcus sp. A15-60]QNI49459.1 hypothetical protein SynA1560_02833 [Synechococcus sp. A15-60]